MTKQRNDRVKSMELIAEDVYKMTLESEYVSSNAAAGQFVNVKCCDGFHALLRRPISICSVDRKNGSYDLLFQKKGEGTGLLSQKKPGDFIDVLGPFGNGFDLDIKYRRIAVIGGGIGVFPLLFLLNESKAIIKRTYLGFRSKKYITLENQFLSASSTLKISTDDGSYGFNGLATELLRDDMAVEEFDIIYACGPTPMLKAVSDMADINGAPCEISMEQRMGCGFGACLVCACKTRNADRLNDWEYSHVCKDGPVFNSREIIWE